MMQHGSFIFADLSTYDVPTSQEFYAKVFGWDYMTDDGEYHLAYAGSQQVVGMYETPPKFQQMKMPHFWMTYIQVDNRDDIVAQAKELGAIIEATEDSAWGKVALIRDPLGAGFTVYEGDQLHTRTTTTPNTFVRNELWVSDLVQVREFYQTLFGWEYDHDEQLQRLDIHLDGEHIGAIQQLDDEQRGTFQYRNVFFAVTDKAKAIKMATTHGGRVLIDDESYTFCLDHSGTAFFGLIEVD